MSFTFTGWSIKTWYPKLAETMTDEQLNALARLLEEVQKDTLEKAKAIARREASR